MVLNTRKNCLISFIIIIIIRSSSVFICLSLYFRCDSMVLKQQGVD